MIYAALDWYWQIGSDTSKFYSTARLQYVAANDAIYTAWLGNGGVVNRVETEGDLIVYLAHEGVIRPQALPKNGDIADITTVLGDTAISALRAMTPAQAATWVQNNVTDLATAKAFLVTLAKIMCVLARRV